MQEMNINTTSTFIDSTTIGISDSFVDNSNKIGSGNGEAKLYLGHEDSREFKYFFGKRGFILNCRLYKNDLIRFMTEAKPYYFNPIFDYRGAGSLKELWHERMKSVNSLAEDVLTIQLKDQTQIEPPRVYAKSNEKGFDFLRNLPLSNIAKLVIIKYEQSKMHFYDLKLVLDLPSSLSKTHKSDAEDLLRSIQIDPQINIGFEIARIRKDRVGQEKFRSEVLKDCGHSCPFTGVSDASLLIAGHIKPWATSSPTEKVDPKNGFAFTPTYDKLFNDGLITFSDQGGLIISPLLSIRSRKSLNLIAGTVIELPISGEKNKRRRDFLSFHREHVYRN